MTSVNFLKGFAQAKQFHFSKLQIKLFGVFYENNRSRTVALRITFKTAPSEKLRG